MNSPEYQLLQKLSGISGDRLKYFIRGYMFQHEDKLPTLDLIPGANSEPYIREMLGITKNSDVTSKDLLFSSLGVNNIQDAQFKLNNIFTDKNISLTELPNGAIVHIETRPTVNGDLRESFNTINTVNSYAFFTDMLPKLYGIPINLVRTTDNIFNILPQAKTAKAFVHNNEIYLNASNATVEDPVHELMHILLGSMRYTDSAKYFNIVNSIESIPNYQELSKLFPNRTRTDINEEIFVREVAKALLGKSSAIDNLSGEDLLLLERSAIRTLDTLLDGDVSVESLDSIFEYPLKSLANLVQSKTMENPYIGTINKEGAILHRELANLKSRLLKDGLLREEC